MTQQSEVFEFTPDELWEMLRDYEARLVANVEQRLAVVVADLNQQLEQLRATRESDSATKH